MKTGSVLANSGQVVDTNGQRGAGECPMPVYQSSKNLLSGTSLEEAKRLARREYRSIQRRTPRRQAYVRSRYYQKDKIFITPFWEHLNQKNRADQMRRVRLFVAAIDLLRNTTLDPLTNQNPNKSGESLHRFAGKSKDGAYFVVQIKEVKKTGRKDFMSVFPR